MPIFLLAIFTRFLAAWAVDILGEKETRDAVSVEFLSESSEPQCAGVIISSEWVLTTAVCVCNGTPCDASRVVRVRHSDQIYKSTSIVVHPAFAGHWWEGNMAMVRVANASWKESAAVAESPEFSCPFTGVIQGSEVELLPDQPLLEYLIRSQCGSSSFPFHSVCSTSNCVPHLVAANWTNGTSGPKSLLMGSGLFRFSRDGWSLIGILGSSARSENCGPNTNMTIFSQVMPYIPFMLENSNFDVLVQRSICGDGLVSTSEQCDDGNTLPGDGCDKSCNIEAGYVCDSIDDRLCTRSVCTLTQSISTYKAVGVLLLQTSNIQVHTLQRAMAETLGVGLSWIVVENVTQVLKERYIAVVTVRSTVTQVIDRWDSLMSGNAIPLELSIVGVVWAMDQDTQYIVKGPVTNGWNTEYFNEFEVPDNRSLKLPHPPELMPSSPPPDRKTIGLACLALLVPGGLVAYALFNYRRTARAARGSASFICEFPAPTVGEGETTNRPVPYCQAFVGIGKGANAEMARFFSSPAPASIPSAQEGHPTGISSAATSSVCSREGCCCCCCKGGLCKCPAGPAGCSCGCCQKCGPSESSSSGTSPTKKPMPSFRAALFNPYWGSQLMSCGTRPSTGTGKTPSAPMSPPRPVRAPPTTLPMPPLFTPPPAAKSQMKTPKSPPPVNPNHNEKEETLGNPDAV